MADPESTPPQSAFAEEAKKSVGVLDKLNHTFENSVLGRYFQVKERYTTLTTELRAGTVTFLTMAYILAVNGAIVADTGGPCTVNDCTNRNGEPGCMFGSNGVFDPGYMACVAESKRSMVTATAVASFVGCMLMGVWGNLPFAIAPGMGINAFFTYTIVGFFGTGMLTYQQAIAACFIEGWIFIALTISGVRGQAIRCVPKCIMLATSGGIGLFLAFIGMQTANGIGIVSFEPATLVTLGGCRIEDRAPMYTIKDTSTICSADNLANPNVGPASPNYACVNQMKMRSASMWLGIMGGVLMVLLMARGFRGAIMIAILFVTFISWIPDHEASYLGASSQVPGGQARLDYFKKVVQRPDTSKTDLEMDFSAFGTAELWAALFSFLYLDLLDATGTFYSMANYINKRVPGFIDPVSNTFPRMTAAFCVDGVATWIGALMGIPPLTTYIESATGIREGGRTGVTAIMVSIYFLIAMFFTPIISTIPPYATGPALILVGALMIENLLDIDWKDITQAVPAFITIAGIPLTYSIAYGIIGGLLSYLLLYLLLLGYDLLTAPLYNKSCRDILAAAKPDVLKPRAVLLEEELAMHRLRIEKLEKEMQESGAAVIRTQSSILDHNAKLGSTPSARYLIKGWRRSGSGSVKGGPVAEGGEVAVTAAGANSAGSSGHGGAAA